MTELLPEYDEDRVHFGDLKKLFSWYNLLLEKDLLVLDEEETEEDSAE